MQKKQFWKSIKIKKEQLWTIVGVALVAAVIASITTASITGGYTKAEIDAKMEKVSTNQGVLNMLNECVIGKVTTQDGEESGLLNKDLTCNDLCDYYGENIWNKKLTCVEGFMHVATAEGLSSPETCSTSFTVYSDKNLYYEYDCICCSV
ncbi:MAG: hypothetical protein HYW05_02415 [Candidatus Diapherotrites archaeon]|nr:hypothetical protein [Candidatus Diapherotrites archaeon]